MLGQKGVEGAKYAPFGLKIGDGLGEGLQRERAGPPATVEAQIFILEVYILPGVGK